MKQVAPSRSRQDDEEEEEEEQSQSVRRERNTQAAGQTQKRRVRVPSRSAPHPSAPTAKNLLFPGQTQASTSPLVQHSLQEAQT